MTSIDDEKPAVNWNAANSEHGRKIADLLGLDPLPDEGGLFRRMFADENSTAIYYLLVDDDFSALHRLASPETYHYYAGAPLELVVMNETNGAVNTPVLGLDLAAGQRPQLTVPAGAWHGSRSLGAWSLVGTTMAPPFEWDGFALGDRGYLLGRFPQYDALVRGLTRA